MAEANPNTRLEAFSDGVFAIALTLLIIDIKIPAAEHGTGSQPLWILLKHLVPSLFAFILSFLVILISWVNHHAILKQVKNSSPLFVYANGLLLLSVVFVPFPTSLLGEYLDTDQAAPAVFLYDAALALQGIGWICVSGSALKDRLIKNELSEKQMRVNRRNAWFAFGGYSLFAVLALWFPLPVALVTALTWVFWMIYGARVRHE